MLSQLLNMVTLNLAAIPSVPLWDRYVEFLERVLNFLAVTFHSGGIAVIVFTIIVKTMLLPLTIRSVRSSKSMQELQPKIKELQKKYGKDRQKISQETMALYQQYQVNPLAGCLPMVIQIPIFFGVYRSILHLSNGSAAISASHYWGDSFLWLPNLATADPYHILPIMAGAFQFIQTRMSRPAGQGKPSDPQQAMMNTMMNFMPLMVVVFGWGFASGPVIYWVTQSLYSVVQQWLIAGWGAMKDWIPGLPELPEHRQLGYKAPRNLDDVVVVTGDGANPQRSGIMGWMQRKADEAQVTRAKMDEQRQQSSGGGSSGKGGGSAGTSSGSAKGKSGGKSAPASSDDLVVETGQAASPAMKAPRPIKKASTKATTPQGSASSGGTKAKAGAIDASAPVPQAKKVIRTTQQKPVEPEV